MAELHRVIRGLAADVDDDGTISMDKLARWAKLIMKHRARATIGRDLILRDFRHADHGAILQTRAQFLAQGLATSSNNVRQQTRHITNQILTTIMILGIVNIKAYKL